tara:strand:- start:121065 stop:121232 length:168 start_codon:yes stop_codon:yes gene_type:complete
MFNYKNCTLEEFWKHVATTLVANQAGFNQEKLKSFFELDNKIDIFEKFIRELKKV